jgi:aspartate/methionine/tyrosine aminotransferase
VAVSPVRRRARGARSGIRATIDRPLADVVDLTGGDPKFTTPAHIVVAGNRQRPQGLARLREALA